MGAVSTIPAFLDALRTALAARNGLSGVNVFTADVDPESAGTSFIILAADDVETDEFDRLKAGTAEYDEGYPIPCFIWVAEGGSGETGIKAARDAAFDLLEEVIDYLQSVRGTSTCTAALGVRRAYVENVRMAQSIGESLRHCQLYFDIRVKANFTPA